MPIETYAVTIFRPRDYTVAEMKAYIENAVCSHSGSLRPDDPMFGNNKETVNRIQAAKTRDKE